MKKNFTRTGYIFFIFSFCVYMQAVSQSAENIHVHTDKESYLPGETIWFKAYIFENGLPSGSSTNLYAGLYSEAGKLLQEKRYPLFNATGNGEFEIPGDLPDNWVQLRFFTKNMQHVDSNYAYLKAVNIYQKQKTVANEMPLPGKIDIAIFVEGGTLVAGLNNYVALKAMHRDGTADITPAILTDDFGHLADSVYFNSAGLGLVQLTPRAGNKYFISWFNKDGSLQKKALPAMATNGASLHTEIDKGNLHYIVRKNNSIPRFNKLVLLIISGNDTVYSGKILLEKQTQAISKIPVDSLPAGILKIVLNDSEGNILQTKQVYIHQANEPPLIKFIKKSNLPKGKNILEITLRDTFIHRLSVSVADAVFYPGLQTASIEDELLLNRNAGLRNPGLDEKAIDLVLLTSAPPAQRQNKKPVPDNYLSLEAVYQSNKQLPQNELLTVVASDKISGKQFFTLAATGTNWFRQNGLLVYDSSKLYYQLRTKELSKNMVVKETGMYHQPEFISKATPLPQQKRADLQVPTGDTILMDNYREGRQTSFNELQVLKTVKIKSKRKDTYMARIEELDERYTSNMFRGLNRGYQFNLLDEPMVEAYSDLISYLGYRFPGAQIFSDKVGQSRRLILGRGGDIALFINESEATWDMLSSVSITQVAYVKVITGVVLGASFRATGGAIYIYLKRGDEPNPHFVSNMQQTFIKGYDLPKEFLMPDYSDKAESLTKDYRSTLYWNPYIETSKGEQKILIEYYNNDIGKQQILMLKGFNEEGAVIEWRQQIE